MTLLEKIIYLADYIEPSRSFPGVEELSARRCMRTWTGARAGPGGFHRGAAGLRQPGASQYAGRL